MNDIDPQILTVLNLLADDQETIAYRKRLNQITDSVTATILLQQIIYWSKIEKFRPFYKFRGPCSHPWYKEGDSWTEELGFSLAEFDTAIKKIGTKITKGGSKAEAYQGTTPQHMVIYWTDSSRVSWYHLNANLLGKLIILIYLENQESETTQKTKKPNLPSSEITPETTSETTTKDTPADFGIGETDPLDGVPQATDGHQRAVDEANGGQAVDPVMEVVKHLRWLCSGRAAKMPKGKELANYTKCAKALLKEKINTDDWQGVCFAIDDWKEHPPQADVWRRDRTKEPHFALDCIAAHYWTLKDKPFHSTHIIERPPPDEVDELYDWWDSQVAYSYRFKGWLKEVIPISRKNGTVTIDISNASDQQRLESLLVTIASGLPDVDRLEIVDQ